MEIRYSPQLRIERIIIVCRLVLVSCSLLAVLLDPVEPLQNAPLTNRILAGYLAFSLLLALTAWRTPFQLIKIRLATHVADILTFSVLVLITEGVASPFFSYFVFTLFCGALRWQQRGVLWTALAFLFPFIGMGYTLEIIRNTDDQTNRLIIRSTHLIVITSLLAYLTTYERHMRNEFSMLANWPSKIDASVQRDGFLHDLLANAAQVMRAPRLLMIWEEQDQPLRHIAHLHEGEIFYRQTEIGNFDRLVSADFDNSHFLCANAAEPKPKVLRAQGADLQFLHISPLSAELVQRYAVTRVIGLQLSGQKFHGRLFVLDKTAMIADDLTLGILLAHQITALMDQYVSIADLKKAAAARERLSMARDLHDGLLQTLTGIALQVETAKRLLDSNNPEVSKRLGELQTLIIEEQRDLRHYIAKLKPLPQPVENDKLTLHGRLIRLAESIEQQWGLKTSLTLPYPAALEHLPDDIYSLVRESLINSARHALATEVRASLSIEDGRLHLRVSDDGQGFPFQGYYDLAQLTALGLGPKSLMERIQALHGQLRIGSDRSGSVLKMSIPLTEHDWPDAQSINPDPTLSDEPNR